MDTLCPRPTSNGMDQDIKPTSPESSPLTHSAEHIQRRRRVIKSFELEARQARSNVDKFVDGVTYFFGSIKFVFLNAIFFTVWILINVGAVPGITPFDPFPFIFLTFVVSLEAIFLSTIVLINQNRQSITDDLRQEVDLNVNLVAEEEITKILKLMTRLYRHMGISSDNDPELRRMMQPLRPEDIERELRTKAGLRHAEVAPATQAGHAKAKNDEAYSNKEPGA